jgi:hypothetical protein
MMMHQVQWTQLEWRESLLQVTKQLIGREQLISRESLSTLQQGKSKVKGHKQDIQAKHQKRNMQKESRGTQCENSRGACMITNGTVETIVEHSESTNDQKEHSERRANNKRHTLSLVTRNVISHYSGSGP